MTMRSIHIQNIRSLRDTGDIALTPITLLVGENSSGKSTFLRTFPLLKQSIRKRTDGPLLWAGDMDDYVDFGSFKETITNNDITKEISFSFSFILEPKYHTRSRFIPDLYDLEEGYSLKDALPINYSISIKQLGKSDIQAYISKVTIRMSQSEFSFLFSLNPNEIKIIVDGKKVDLEKNNKDEILY